MATAATSASGAAKPADVSNADTSAGGAAKLADSSNGNDTRKFLPLSHLTAQSARVGVWKVMVWKPVDISRTYPWEGNLRKSQGIKCILISIDDPKQYILADSHGKGMTEQNTQALLKKLQHDIQI